MKRSKKRSISSLLQVCLLLCAASCWQQKPAIPKPDFTLTPALASQLVRLSLDCVDRPWPNKPGHVLDGETALKAPAQLTPAFFGCFDWHSAVHGHWALARVLGRFPHLPEKDAIRQKLAAHLTPQNIEQERQFFLQERNRTFERPYGMGWLLRLYAELHTLPDPDAKNWESAVAPLGTLMMQRLGEYLGRLTVPVRSGTHDNTAYAMIHALDAARVFQYEAFEKTLIERARSFYLADRQCPAAYEPSGEDFISPCLVEADLMRRVLPPGEFSAWYRQFLPPTSSPGFATLRTPVAVRDRHDPRIGHLIGLSFQRAAALRGIASTLSFDDRQEGPLLLSASQHAKDGLAQMMDSGYGGSHWLASFALYLFTDVGLP